MKYLVLLSAVFLDWPVEIMAAIKNYDPDARFIGLANTSRVQQEAQNRWPDMFDTIIDLEAEEEKWLVQSHSPAELAHKLDTYDQLLGPGLLQKIVVADRHVGAGYISGADSMHSRLIKAVHNRTTLQSYLVHMMDFFDRLLEDQKVDRVFLYCVASGPSLALGELCRVKNIVFQHFQPTRIKNRYIVDSSITGLCHEISEVFTKSRSSPSILDEHRAEAANILREYREQNTVPEYVIYNKKLLSKSYAPLTLLKTTARAFIKIFMYRILHGRPRLRGESHFQEFVGTFLRPIRFWITRNFVHYASHEDLPKGKYVYFPLHVDPEASTMVITPDHTNQLALLENLSRAVPYSMPIVVKDHAPMVGVRPLWFYKRIQALPNVLLVNPYAPSLNLVKESGLVVTITGTAGWEAMIFGKPALIMGASPFEVMGKGMIVYGDVSGLGKAIQSALKLPPVDGATLIDYIASVLKVSFSCPMKLLWGNPDQAMIKEHSSITDRVAREISGRSVQG